MVTVFFRDLVFLASMPVLAQEIPAPEHLSSWLIDAAAMLLVFLKVLDHFKRKPSLEQELEKLLRQLRTERLGGPGAGVERAGADFGRGECESFVERNASAADPDHVDWQHQYDGGAE